MTFKIHLYSYWKSRKILGLEFSLIFIDGFNYIAGIFSCSFGLRKFFVANSFY